VLAHFDDERDTVTAADAETSAADRFYLTKTKG
jgi:hypothetical protein